MTIPSVTLDNAEDECKVMTIPSVTLDNTEDECKVMTIPSVTLWVRSAKNVLNPNSIQYKW
jgi:hypothetical protein